MGKFVVEPHFRLQEWVAEEKGYFRAEGLDYEFSQVDRPAQYADVQVAESAPEIRDGAFESYEGDGRACEVSTSCLLSVCPSIGIFRSASNLGR